MLTRSEWAAALAALGIAGLLMAMNRRAVASGAVLSKIAIRDRAAAAIDRHGFTVDPALAANIAMVESGGDPSAARFEPFVPHVGGPDVSTGLMQVLKSTAFWLATDMGYRAYGSADLGERMLDPEIGLYFGLAYLDYLGRYRGEVRGEAWIVQSYNAGPGNAQLAYLAKYRAEQARGF